MTYDSYSDSLQPFDYQKSQFLISCSFIILSITLFNIFKEYDIMPNLLKYTLIFLTQILYASDSPFSLSLLSYFEFILNLLF